MKHQGQCSPQLIHGHAYGLDTGGLGLISSMTLRCICSRLGLTILTVCMQVNEV